MFSQLKITECQLAKTYCQVDIYIFSVLGVLIVGFSVLLTSKLNNTHSSVFS